jgi:hypothetical protein
LLLAADSDDGGMHRYPVSNFLQEGSAFVIGNVREEQEVVVAQFALGAVVIQAV